jgi:molybdopterin-binding protein
MRLSARNQIPARVTSINQGEAIANVELDAGGVRLVASITVEAVGQLGLTEGAEVTAVIKASDVIIAIAELPRLPRETLVLVQVPGFWHRPRLKPAGAIVAARGGAIGQGRGCDSQALWWQSM